MTSSARGSTDGDQPARSATRAQRRASMEAAILQAARETFAAHGYQRATIRAVARLAGCDPALVMHYFGSKDKLFRAATALNIDVGQVFDEDSLPGNRNERLLRHVFGRLDAQPTAAAATLRSMLTHDHSAEQALRLFGSSSGTVGGGPEETSGLRTRLSMAVVLGTAIVRYLLTAPELEHASLDELVAALRPALDSLGPL